MSAQQAVVRLSNCKKCGSQTKHRLVKSQSYWSCTICTENNSKSHRKRHWLKYLAQKANSRSRVDSVKVTEEMLQKIHDHQNGKCALTKVPFNMEAPSTRPSLDRIDSSKGYVQDNLQLVITDINKMKQDLPMPAFYTLCLLVSKNYDPSSS